MSNHFWNELARETYRRKTPRDGLTHPYALEIILGVLMLLFTFTYLIHLNT